jgi:NodT family efflux transporter outer membrane factor (OMF) lipoprotein
MLTKKLFFLPLLGLVGCMVGPDFQKPEPPATESYTEEALPPATVNTPGIKGGHAQIFKVGQDIPNQWWELYESPELNHLIIRGLENNPDLKAAEATLQQAQEDLRSLIGATLYPNVGLELDAGRERLSAFDSLEGSPGEDLADFPPQLLDLYNANVSVSYVFDVFGANRRAIEALRAGLDFERYQLEATYLALTSNIVTTAILEGSLRAQIKATKEMIAQETQLLNITNKQYHAGGTSRFDVLAQETVLAQTRANLPPLENALAQTRHALAVLVGDYPGSEMLPKFYLDDLHLPEELPISIPSELINQRPDIQAAEALLHQASAQVGVATANMLPTFPIIASYGANSDSLNDFFNTNNIYWDWQASVLQPIFAGGALEAQRESAIFAFEAAFAEYQSAVLMGLQNVADTLTALENDARTLHETAIAEKAAKNMLDISQKQFEVGSINFIDLIYAQVAYQQTYLDRITALAARYADTAALFQALGGPWWDDDEYEDENENENNEYE